MVAGVRAVAVGRRSRASRRMRYHTSETDVNATPITSMPLRITNEWACAGGKKTRAERSVAAVAARALICFITRVVNCGRRITVRTCYAGVY